MIKIQKIKFLGVFSRAFEQFLNELLNTQNIPFIVLAKRDILYTTTSSLYLLFQVSFPPMQK